MTGYLGEGDMYTQSLECCARLLGFMRSAEGSIQRVVLEKMLYRHTALSTKREKDTEHIQFRLCQYFSKDCQTLCLPWNRTQLPLAWLCSRIKAVAFARSSCCCSITGWWTVPAGEEGLRTALQEFLCMLQTIHQHCTVQFKNLIFNYQAATFSRNPRRNIGILSKLQPYHSLEMFWRAAEQRACLILKIRSGISFVWQPTVANGILN